MGRLDPRFTAVQLIAFHSPQSFEVFNDCFWAGPPVNVPTDNRSRTCSVSWSTYIYRFSSVISASNCNLSRFNFNWNLMGTDSVQIQLRQLDRLVNSTDIQVPAVRPRIAVVRCESNWMNKIAESSHPLRMQNWVGAGVTMRVVHWNGFSVSSIRVTDLNITTYADINIWKRVRYWLPQ